MIAMSLGGCFYQDQESHSKSLESKNWLLKEDKSQSLVSRVENLGHWARQLVFSQLSFLMRLSWPQELPNENQENRHQNVSHYEYRILN
mgnify:CR=1 FL=1